MIRTIVTPENTDIHLAIPQKYVGKPIEITCIALDEMEQKPLKTMGDFFGILQDESYDELKKQTEQARREWNRNS